MPRKVNSVLELVGNTPLVRINRLNPVAGVEVLVKLEGLNPGGSVKDRIALKMIEQAEAAGELTPGKIVLEASSGNTAIGLAMVCAVKGYQLLVTMSESASEERKRILKAYGRKSSSRRATAAPTGPSKRPTAWPGKSRESMSWSTSSTTRPTGKLTMRARARRFGKPPAAR